MVLKVGDKVKCVDIGGWASHLQPNTIYTISRITDWGNPSEVYLKEDTIHTAKSYSQARFVLVKGHKNKPDRTGS